MILLIVFSVITFNILIAVSVWYVKTKIQARIYGKELEKRLKK